MEETIATGAPRARKRPPVLLTAIAGFLILAALFVINRSPRHGDPISENYTIGRIAFSKWLPKPATAQWSEPGVDSNTGAIDFGGGVWEAFGEVEAENRAGARSRERWRIVFSPKKRDVYFVSIGDEKKGNLEEARSAAAGVDVPALNRRAPPR